MIEPALTAPDHLTALESEDRFPAGRRSGRAAEHVGEFAANDAAAVEPEPVESEPVALEPVANQPDPAEATDPSWEPQGSDVPLDLPAVDLPVAEVEPEAPLSAELPAEDAFAAEMLASFESTEEPAALPLAAEWREPTAEQPAAALPADDLD